MNNFKLGNNLIFLISQPRAGSTLLQRILGSHPEIHTLSEPWIMLHPIYAYKEKGLKSEYNEMLANSALKDFLSNLPNNEEDYYEGLRRMYSYLYYKALITTNKEFFLDKTPRYYLIIKELYRIFPKAKFIILFRNPLAVLCSFITTWTPKNLFNLRRFNLDLVNAPKYLVNSLNMIKDQCIVVNYESILINPEIEIKKICKLLGIEFVPSIIEYGKNDSNQWQFGDKKSVYKYSKPKEQNIGKWKKKLKKPQIWRLYFDYLHILGPNTIKKMGYSYNKLLNILEISRPKKIRLIFTLHMNKFLESSKINSIFSKVNFLKIRLSGSIKKRGYWGTIKYAIKKVRYKIIH